MNLTEKVYKSLLVSGLIGFLVFASAMTIYLGNLQEYSFPIELTLEVLFPFAGFIFLLVLGVQIAWLKSDSFSNVFLFFFAFAIHIWVQGEFLNWPLSNDLNEIQSFSMHLLTGIVELLIIAAIFGGVFHFRNFVLKNSLKLAGIVIFAEIVAVLPLLFKYNEKNLRTEYETAALFSTVHKFSSQSNIIVIVADSFGNSNFTQALKSTPQLRDGFRDFTHFPRFLSKYPQTFFALPTLLTGNDLFDRTLDEFGNNPYLKNFQNYRDAIKQMYSGNEVFLELLFQNGFQIELYPGAGTDVYFPPNREWIVNCDPAQNSSLIVPKTFIQVIKADLLPFTMYRISPLIVKRKVLKFYSKRQAEIYKFLTFGKLFRGFAEDGKTILTSLELYPDDAFFQFPDQFQPQFQSQKCFKLIHLPGLHLVKISKYSIDSKEITDFSSNYLHKLQEYMEFLKKKGIYDSSWILLLGDHGMHQASFPEQHNPFLLIKPPHTNHSVMETDETIVLMRDLAPTLLAAQEIVTSKPFSIWKQTESQKAERQQLWEKYVIHNQKKN